MKRFVPLLAAVALLAFCVPCQARHPLRPWLDASPCANGQCQQPAPAIPPLPVASAADDQADMAEAVARGFGSRLAVGPYRECTLAVREWLASDNHDLGKLQDRLGRTPRFTACQKAEMAVIALEMVNSFSPGTIPPQVLTLALQLEAAACGTPTPTPNPVPIPTVNR
jgi:hypothetical protein